jgi:hypothetical protein
MTDFRVELEGTEALQKILDNADDPAVRRGLGQAMFGFATKILNESKKLVPVDTGALRNSGKVEGPTVDSNGVEVEITYGGAGIQYAGVIHEDMSLSHSPTLNTAITKKPRRGQAKYLETPVKANEDDFARDVAVRYARYMRRGA